MLQLSKKDPLYWFDYHKAPWSFHLVHTMFRMPSGVFNKNELMKVVLTKYCRFGGNTYLLAETTHNCIQNNHWITQPCGYDQIGAPEGRQLAKKQPCSTSQNWYINLTSYWLQAPCRVYGTNRCDKAVLVSSTSMPNDWESERRFSFFNFVYLRSSCF